LAFLRALDLRAAIGILLGWNERKREKPGGQCRRAIASNDPR
jgi:hypothetical protein